MLSYTYIIFRHGINLYLKRLHRQQRLHRHFFLLILVPVNSFMCNNCGRSYKHKRNLFAHKKYDCGIQPKFSCDICFRKFAHRSHLRNHLITIHKII